MTFERFLASLYMTAMMQLGLMRQQGEQPRIDIIGARQTIDTLSLIAEKTKGNLTPAEENFLQNSLYELRMAYVEVTNALARPPQAGPAHGNRNPRKMKATLTVLGSGTSMGVPTLGCDCAVCHSTDPHDRRTRPSIMLEYGGKVVLIDTTPDFYTQAIRENITRVDAVLYTHTHADHILGIDDLRPLSYRHKPDKLPLYARPDAAAFLRKMFSYIFDADYKFGGLPQLELRADRWAGRCIWSAVRAGDSDSRRNPDLWLPVRLGGVSDGPQRDSGVVACISWKDSTFCFWMRCGTSRIPRTRR